MSSASPGRDARQPVLTIVIPVWDKYVRLLPALVSELRQRAGTDFDLVIVDNRSSVPLPAFTDARVVRLANRTSTGAARNAGLALVETPFVYFLDADDRPTEGAVAKLVSALTSEPNAVVATGEIVAWHPQSAVQLPMASPRRRTYVLSRRPRLLGLASVARNQFAVVGAVLSTNAVRDAGGFSDHNYCEDWALATALAFRGRIILRRSTTLMAQIHEGSMIHREGTPGAIVRALPWLHRRWLRDPAIPWWLKPLFPFLALVRLRQAWSRWRYGARSHDDLLEQIGNLELEQFGIAHGTTSTSGMGTKGLKRGEL